MSENDIECYSCKELVTLESRRENDGDCPACEAELDLEVYFNSLAVDNKSLQQRNAELEARVLELEKSLLIPVSDLEYPRDIFHKLIKKSPYAFYLFQWVPYQTDARQWRLKMCHDVKHKDGRIEYGIWPNGSSCGSFKDDDVEFIRISRGQMGGTYTDPRDRDNAQSLLESSKGGE